MQLNQRFEVAVPRDRVFAFLRDVRSLAPCLPGCKELREVGNNNRYAAVIEVAVAFLKLRFEVQVEVTEAVEPERLTARITGRPTSVAGQLTMVTDLRLSELEDGRTEVSYTIDLTLTGRLGSIGQSAFRAKAEEMGAQFARNLKAALEGNVSGVVA